MTQMHKTRVRDALSAYGTGDAAAILALVATDVEWTQHVPKHFFPAAGEGAGREGLTNAIKKIGEDYEFKSLSVESVAADGDAVWAVSDAAIVRRDNRRPIVFKIVSRWLFRGDEAYRYDEFWDSAGVLLQEGRIGAPEKAASKKPAEKKPVEKKAAARKPKAKAAAAPKRPAKAKTKKKAKRR